MIPKYLVPKVEVQNNPSIQVPKIIGKAVCELCSENFNVENGFIILRPNSNKFTNLCSKCAQIRMFGKVSYFEDYPTFAKRLKSGQFEDWKVIYEKN